MITNDDLKYFIPYLFRENIFPHQLLQERSTIAYMHYALPSLKDFNGLDPTEYVKRTPTVDKIEIFKWLDFLASNPFGAAVRDYVLKIWPQITKELSHFCSFNIHIEGNIPYHGIYKTRLFSHYHAPRNGAEKSMTYSFVKPLCINQDIIETVRFSDYHDIGFTPLTQNQVFANCKTAYDYAVAMSEVYEKTEKPGLIWQQIPFPSNGTLNLKFDGARYPHSVENQSNNVFMVLVFNDVMFNSEAADICSKHDDFFYQYTND